jgi:hypothetical protein
MRSLLPRLPSEMQWLKTFYVAAHQALVSFHYRKAAKSRASGSDPFVGQVSNLS